MSFVKVFDFEQWPSSLQGSDDARKFGIDEISKLAEFFYCKHDFITPDEQELPKKHWPLFWEKNLKATHF